MTKQTTGTKGAITATIMLLLIAAVCFLQFVGNVTTANATMAAETPSQVYYISDSEKSEDFAASLVDNGYADSVTLYSYPKDKAEGISEHEKYNDYVEYVFSEVYSDRDMIGTYIVFEWSKKMYAKDLDEYKYILDTMPNILQNNFSELKNQGCQIMFICNTDEACLIGKNQFLDYVDIHVNTDLFFTFITNALDRIESECNEEAIKGTTIIFDNTFLENDKTGINWVEEWMFREFILIYFKSVFLDEMQTNPSLRDVLEYYRVRLLCHLGDSRFIDLMHRNVIDFNDADNGQNSFVYYFMREHVAVMGTTWSGEEYSKDFLNILSSMYETCNQDINYDVYMFNEDKVNFSDCDFGVMYTVTPDYDWELNLITENFLAGDELSLYDNWNGRCVVTHKVNMSGDGNGWVEDLNKDFDLADDSLLLGEMSELFKDGWKLNPWAFDSDPSYNYVYLYDKNNIF